MKFCLIFLHQNLIVDIKTCPCCDVIESRQIYICISLRALWCHFCCFSCILILWIGWKISLLNIVIVCILFMTRNVIASVRILPHIYQTLCRYTWQWLSYRKCTLHVFFRALIIYIVLTRVSVFERRYNFMIVRILVRFIMVCMQYETVSLNCCT